jgi:hypothetical protein
VLTASIEAYDEISQITDKHSVMPVLHNEYARLPMGIPCIIQYVTLHYPADVQTSDFSVKFYSEWLTA